MTRHDDVLATKQDDPVFPAWDIPETPQAALQGSDYLSFVEFCWRQLSLVERQRLRQQRDRLIPTVRFEL